MTNGRMISESPAGHERDEMESRVPHKQLTMIRRRAAWASGVTVSASSKMITLNGGFGYSLPPSSSMSILSSAAALPCSASATFFWKKEPTPLLLLVEFAEELALPTARLAKCLILSLTTDIPRSSLAFNSSTRRRHWDGCHNWRHNANATDVYVGDEEKFKKQIMNKKS